MTLVTLNSFLQDNLGILIYFSCWVLGIERGFMKFPFLKTLIVAGALLFAWNCSDDTTISVPNSQSSFSVEAWEFETPDGILYITENGSVLDIQGNEVAQLGEGDVFSIGDDEYHFDREDREKITLIKDPDGKFLLADKDGNVKDPDGNVIGQMNDDGTVTDKDGNVVVDLNDDDDDNGSGNENGNGNGYQTGSSSNSNGNGNQTGSSSNSNGNNNGNRTGSRSNSNGNNNGNQAGNSSSSNGNNNTPTSSAVVTHQTVGNITVDGALIQTAQKNSNISIPNSS